MRCPMTSESFRIPYLSEELLEEKRFHLLIHDPNDTRMRANRENLI